MKTDANTVNDEQCVKDAAHSLTQLLTNYDPITRETYHALIAGFRAGWAAAIKHQQNENEDAT